MNCKNCDGICIKKGFYKTTQRCCCKSCGKYQQQIYSYRRYTTDDEKMIIKLNNVSVGICGISEVTGIPKATVVRKIKKIAQKIKKPVFTETLQDYEADEMHTYIKKKENQCYIIYAINKMTKRVIDFTIGKRTKENIGKIISSLKILTPKKISTDRLNIYPLLIEKSIHSIKYSGINHIERNHLTLRTRLKGISRRTICFSKSMIMLENCLRIYLWGGIT